jgi:hypothetical protein
MAGSSTKRVQKYRERMNAAGLKRVTIPDVNAPGYAEQLAREIEIINTDADSQRVMEEMLALGDFRDWK